MKTNNFYRDVEYVMSKATASNLLKTRKPGEMGMSPQVWLVNYVNDTYRIKGHCTRVTIE